MANCFVASSVRFNVVQALQTRLRNLPEGSGEALATEHAIALALNPGRHAKNEAFLYRNVIRDARHSKSRRAASAIAISFPVSVGPPDGVNLEGGVWEAVDEESPEQVVIAVELERRIRYAAMQMDCHGERCLDGIFLGETEEETAHALGISSLRVKHLRSRIRHATRKLIGWSN